MSFNRQHIESELDIVEKGIGHKHFSTFKGFSNFIYDFADVFAGFIFRGHVSEHWKLISSLERIKEKLPETDAEKAEQRQIDMFKKAMRGRQQLNANNNLKDDDWWAIGRHFGLATPLLDWTTSPFIASYFAFTKSNDVITSNDGNCAVWALNRYYVDEELSDPGNPIVFEPQIDESLRLLNQAGVFTRPPEQFKDLIDWYSQTRNNSTKITMLKFTIPLTENIHALRFLKRMNITANTLFPDHEGAGFHCNLSLKIPYYSGWEST